MAELWSNAAFAEHLPALSRQGCGSLRIILHLQQGWNSGNSGIGASKPGLWAGYNKIEPERRTLKTWAGFQIGCCTLAWTFELLCWLYLDASYLLVLLLGCVIAVDSCREQREEDLSEDVCLHSAGPAPVEKLHLQKTTNGKLRLETVLM